MSISPEWMSNWRERSGWSLAARGTAALTVFCFVLTQLPLQVFAQHPELPEWLKEEQGGWVSAEQAQRLHRADAELLTFLSTLEQSKERLVTASASGIQTLHAGGRPVVSRDTANNLLFKPTVQIASPAKEQGGLAMTGTETISGTLLLADGTLQVIEEGKVTRQVDPFGTETFFDVSERPLYEIAPDGTRTDYSYSNPVPGTPALPIVGSEPGTVTRTTHLPNGDLTQLFDSEGLLLRQTTPEGKTSLYEAGILKSVAEGGLTSEYTRQSQPDGSLTATLTQLRDASGILYSIGNGQITAVRYPEGAVESLLSGVSSRWQYQESFSSARPRDFRFSSRVSVSGGSLVLSGNGKDLSVNAYHNSALDRSDGEITFRTSFSVNSNDTSALLALEGSNAKGLYRRLELFHTGKTLQVRTKEGGKTTLRSTPITNLTLNAVYQVEFVVTATRTSVYVWKSGSRPSKPAYSWTLSDWDPRFHAWVQKGTLKIQDLNLTSSSPSGALPSLPDLPRRLVYTQDRSLREVAQANGTILRFSQGIPTEVIASDGTVARLSAEETGKLLKSFSTTRSQVTRTYDAQGKLTSLTLADQTTVHLADEAIRALRLPDGTTITEGIYDSESRLVSGLVTMLDGRTIRYLDGQPTEARLPDGTTIGYADGQPSLLALPDGTTYALTLRQAQGDREASWEAVRAEPAEARTDTLTRLVYSDSWELQEATRADEAELTYLDGLLATLTQANGTVISYAYDGSGRLSSTVAASPDPAQAAIRTEYAYDKIRRVFKGSDLAGSDPQWSLIYDYSYEFPSPLAGEGGGEGEITVVREVSTGLTKRYREGLLISQTDPDGAITTYEYTTDPAGYGDPFDAAVGATQTLSDGTVADYERQATGGQSPAGTVPLTLTQLTLPDGHQLLLTGGRVTGLIYPDGRVETEVNPSNLLGDYASLEGWSNGTAHAPDGWIWSGGPGDGIAQESSPENVHSGSTSVKLTADAASDNESFIYRNIVPFGDKQALAQYEGKTITFGAWVKTDDPETSLVVVVDDVVGSTRSGTHPGDGQWHFLTVTRVVGRDIFKLVAYLDVVGANKTAYLDDAVFVVGPEVLTRDFTPLIAQAQLPADRQALRRLVEQGTLKLIEPDELDKKIDTAVGATRTAEDGTVIHYERASSAQPWQTVGLTPPDGRYLAKPDSLSPYPLAGPSFEGWSSGPAEAPDGWRWSGGSGNSVSQATDPDHIHLEGSSVQLATPALKLANGSDGSDYSFIVQDIVLPYSPEVRALAGKTFTLGVWVKSDRPGAARIGLSSNEYDFSAFHPGDNQWHLLTITHTITTGSINFNAWIKVNGFQASAYFDDAKLIEGPAELLLLSDPAQLRSLELPADRASLRRLIEQGVLSLRGGPAGADEAISSSQIASASPRNDHSPVLSRAVVTYQGKPRESFTYRYSDSLTRVTDSSGTTRTYDATKRLVAIEQPDGTRHSVTTSHDLSDSQRAVLQTNRARVLNYTDPYGRTQTLELPDIDLTQFNEPIGEEVTIQHLTRRLLADGTELTYAFGRLESIRLPDGKILTDLTTDRNGVPLRGKLTLPDGTTKPIQNSALVEVSRADGTRLRYRDGTIAEIRVPINLVSDVTVSAVGLDGSGRLQEGEVLLPLGDRLILRGGRFTSARLADGTEVRSVTVNQDAVTGATLSVSGSNATLSDSRDVGVTLPSGQQYRYRYKLDSQGNPTNSLETMTFRDDFEDGNSLGWTVQAGSDWTVTGGDLRARDTEYGFVLATTGLNWADYSVTTRFSYESFTGPAKEAALLFRWQGPSSYYMARVLDRSFQGRGWVLELTGPLTGERTIASLGGFDPGGTHSLRVDVRGSTFDFYLDGQYKGSTSDSRASRGTVGLGTNHAITRFHDLEVTFPGEDLRDPATHEIDDKLRSLRQVVTGALGPIRKVGAVPARFDPASVDPQRVRILESSSDPDVQAAIQAVQAASSDLALPVVSELEPTGRVVTSVALDGSVTLYDPAGRPSARYDADGRLQVTYAYDARGYLSKTTLVAAREDLAEQIALSKQEVTARSAAALETLARQQGRSFDELRIQAQVAREQLANSQEALEDQQQSLESTPMKGKEGRKVKSDTLDEIRKGREQIREAQQKLEEDYIEQLSRMDSKIRDLKGQIESGSDSSFAQIASQEAEFIKSILRQEMEPILYQRYRTGIGRDPDEAEITRTVENLYQRAGSDPSAALDLEAIEAEIRALPDYQPRVEEIAEIKSRVRQWLTRYAQIPSPLGGEGQGERERTSLLLSLGLSPDEVVPLTASDINRVLAWLDSRSMHFGYSAFLALKEYVDSVIASPAEGEAKQSPDFITLATEVLLTDILVGVLNPKVQPDAELELSLFALQKVAKLHGASATPSRVSFEDLRALVIPAQAGIASPAIAHVNGNHYILILSIAADGTVTYQEPNRGPAGETLTMSKEIFLKQWQGVILSARAPPQAHQILTPQEAQAITGSFFQFLILAIAAIAAAIVIAVTAVVTAIATLLVSLGTLLAGVFSAFGTAFAGFFNGLGLIFSGNILGGLATIGQGLFAGLTGLINAGLGFLGLGSLSQLGTLAGLKTALANFAFRSVLSTGVNLGVSKGLEALGVNSTVASLVGAFAGGFIVGGPAPTSGAGAATATASSGFLNALSNGLTSVAIAGTQLGLTKAGLDPALAGIASIGVGAITNSMLSGIDVPIRDVNGDVVLDADGNIFGFERVFGLKALGPTLSTQLAPTMAGELAFYGIQRLGESIGLDPRLSVLAGIPVRTSVASALTGTSYRNTVDAIGQGLRQGVTSLAIEVVGQEAGLDPLLTSLASRTITGAIEGAYSKQGLFQGIANAYGDSAEHLFTMGGVGDNPVARATYLAKINDFSQIIQERGLASALETYATSVFQRDAVESIWRQGGIADFITSRAQVVDENGTLVKRVFIGDSTTITVSLDEKNLLGIERNGVIQKGTFKIDPATGAFGLTDGTIEYTDRNGSRIRLTTQNGELLTFEIRNLGEPWLKFRATAGSPDVFQGGYIASGIIEDESLGFRFTFQNGSLTHITDLVTGQPIQLHNTEKERHVREKLVAFFSCGIGNPECDASTEEVVALADIVIQRYQQLGIPAQKADTHVFTNQGGLLGKSYGVLQVAGEVFLPLSINKEEFKQDLRKKLMDLPPEERAIVKINGYFYSGSGQTALEAINELANEEGISFQFQNLVLVGSPHMVTPTLQGANIKHLHIFEGTKDPLARIRLNFNPNFKPVIHIRQFEGFAHGGEEGYFSLKNQDVTAQAIFDAWQTE